jgi:hypothetical protein
MAEEQAPKLRVAAVGDLHSRGGNVALPLVTRIAPEQRFIVVQI